MSLVFPPVGSSLDELKAWALSNYENSFGCSALLECYEDANLVETFGPFPLTEEGLDRLDTFIDVADDRHAYTREGF